MTVSVSVPPVWCTGLCGNRACEARLNGPLDLVGEAADLTDDCGDYRPPESEASDGGA